jgi:ribosome-binding protein aMBF1 (putative translation factor)
LEITMIDSNVVQFPTPVEQRHADLQLVEDQKLIASLVTVRKRRGLSQEDLAAAMGCDVEVVARFEHPNSDPCLSTARRYAAVVGAEVKHVTTYWCDQ